MKNYVKTKQSTTPVDDRQENVESKRSYFKHFGKGTIVYAIGNIGTRATSFLLIPLYTRILSLEEYGLFFTMLVVIQLMIILMSVGVRTSFLRFIKDNTGQVGQLLGSLIVTNLIGGFSVTGISFLILKPFFRNLFHSQNVDQTLLLICLASLSQSLCLNVMTYFRAQNKPGKFVLAGFSCSFLLISMSVLFLLVLNQGIHGALLSIIIAYSIVFLVILTGFFRNVVIEFSMKMTAGFFRYGSPLILSMLGQFIIGSMGIYFLNRSSSLENVAIYSLGYKLSQIMVMVLILPFQLVYEPFVFANSQSDKIKDTLTKMFTYFVFTFLLSSIVLIIGCYILFPLIAPSDYTGAYLVFMLLLPASLFIGMYYFGEVLINVRNKTKTTGMMVTGCTLVSLLVYYLLVPRYGLYGAIISLNVSYMLLGISSFLIGVKKLSLAIEWKRIGLLAFCYILFLTTAILLWRAKQSLFPVILSCAAIIGVILLYLLRFFDKKEDEVIRHTLQKLKLAFLTLQRPSI